MDIWTKVHMMWGVMVLLFILSLILRKQKVWPMLLRLSFIVMLVSGSVMLYYWNFATLYVVKGILALLLFGVMEMLVGKARRGEPPVPLLWVLFVILIILIPAIGYNYISF